MPLTNHTIIKENVKTTKDIQLWAHNKRNVEILHFFIQSLDKNCLQKL